MMNQPTNKRSLKCLQCNVDRGKIAMNLLEITAHKMKTDVMAIQEPNQKLADNQQYITDKKKDASIRVFNSDVKIYDWKAGDGYVWAEFENFVLYSCYVSPNIGINEYEAYLTNLGESIS